MKYLEELIPGDLFIYQNKYYLLTCDFKLIKNNDKKYFCVNIKEGFSNWIIGNVIVDELDLYYRDTDGNIVALKERRNEYSNQTKKFQ